MWILYSEYGNKCLKVVEQDEEKAKKDEEQTVVAAKAKKDADQLKALQIKLKILQEEANRRALKKQQKLAPVQDNRTCKWAD